MSGSTPAITYATFTARYPEFRDGSIFVQPWVQSILDEALNMFPSCRYGQMYFRVLGLYTAHQLSLGRRMQLEAAKGGIPGTSGDVVASKAAGGLSLSFDTAAGTEKEAGWWNLTIYGRQAYELIQMAGAGGMTDPRNIATQLWPWYYQGGGGGFAGLF